MRSRARLIVAATAIAAVTASAPVAAGAPTASSAAETLVAYGGKKKLKIGKRITFPVTCAVNCNARAVVFVSGPGKVPKLVVSGALPAATPAPVVLKPNGPLLKAFKRFPGRFVLKTKISATDPLTGESDVDKRNFRLKR